MACSTNLIADIINDCTARPVKGIYPTTWVIPFDGRKYEKTNNLITSLTSPSGVFRKIESNKFGLNVSSELVTNDVKSNGYLHKFSGILSQVGNKELDELDGIIVVVKKGTTYMVYGLQNGLWKSAQSRTANDNSGMLTVEFSSRADMEEDYSEYYFDTSSAIFGALPPATFVELDEHVTGLSITTGADISSNAIVRFSDGSVMDSPTSESAPSTGDVVFFIAKGGSLSIYTSGVAGVLHSPTCIDIDVSGSPNVTGINAPFAEYIIATECGITAVNIAVIMANAVANGATGGSIDLTNGTNASYATWSVQAKADKTTLVGRGWTIINNA